MSHLFNFAFIVSGDKNYSLHRKLNFMSLEDFTDHKIPPYSSNPGGILEREGKKKRKKEKKKLYLPYPPFLCL